MPHTGDKKGILIMSERVEKALELYANGHNCAQAVACAYCDLVGADTRIIYQVSEGFGGGVGDHRQICGALSGAVIITGLVTSAGEPTDPPTKGETYRLAQAMTQRFEEQNQSVICKALRGETGGPVLRSCPGCVQDACEILEELVLNQPQPIA